MKNGLMLAAFHVALILTIGAKFAYERAVLPRGWMRTMPVDPNTPLRGRYVSLRSLAKKESGYPAYTQFPNAYGRRVVLTARGGEVWAKASPDSAGEMVSNDIRDDVQLYEPLSYFIPEHVADPSRVKADEELWVEVNVPPTGPPRPIRLEVRKKITPESAPPSP